MKIRKAPRAVRERCDYCTRFVGRCCCGRGTGAITPGVVDDPAGMPNGFDGVDVTAVPGEGAPGFSGSVSSSVGSAPGSGRIIGGTRGVRAGLTGGLTTASDSTASSASTSAGASSAGSGGRGGIATGRGMPGLRACGSNRRRISRRHACRKNHDAIERRRTYRSGTTWREHVSRDAAQNDVERLTFRTRRSARASPADRPHALR